MTLKGVFWKLARAISDRVLSQNLNLDTDKQAGLSSLPLSIFQTTKSVVIYLTWTQNNISATVQLWCQQYFSLEKYMSSSWSNYFSAYC